MELKKYIVESVLKLKSKLNRDMVYDRTSGVLDVKNSKVVFVFLVKDIEEIENISKLLSPTKNKFSSVFSLFVVETKTEIVVASKTEMVISLADFSYFGSFQNEKMNILENLMPDIILSFVSKDDLITNTLLSYIKSGLRVGPYLSENHNLYDFTIKHSDNDFSRQLEHYEHYLTNLNIVT